MKAVETENMFCIKVIQKNSAMCVRRHKPWTSNFIKPLV